MKPIFALLGILSLTYPVVTHLSFDRQIFGASTVEGLLLVLSSVPTGFVLGFLGATILGVVCDGGTGYAPWWIVAVMFTLGLLWIVGFPQGWIIGAPLLIYAASKGARKVADPPRKS